MRSHVWNELRALGYTDEYIENILRSGDDENEKFQSSFIGDGVAGKRMPKEDDHRLEMRYI